MTFLIFFEFIPYFIRPEAPGFHVDSTQNAWEGKGCPTPTHSAWIHMESMWNPCRIHGILMDSRQSCSAEFPRIPWNLHGICVDSAWIPCTFLAGNTPIFLPTGMPGIHTESMEIPHGFRRFRAEWVGEGKELYFLSIYLMVLLVDSYVKMTADAMV